jgi:hypothetical protein
MNRQITLTVSENVWLYAKAVASRNKQQVEDFLSGLLEGLSKENFTDKLSDEEIIALTEFKISPAEQERLSELLFKNREGKLNQEEQNELDLMLEITERNMLRKSEALRVAVERGLIEPLS